MVAKYKGDGELGLRKMVEKNGEMLGKIVVVKVEKR